MLLAPVYGLYRLVGPANAEWLAHGLGLAEAGGAEMLGGGYFAVLGGITVPVVLVLAAATRMARLATMP